MREHPQPKESDFVARGLIAIRSIYNWIVETIASMFALLFTIAFTSVGFVVFFLGVVFIRAIVISFTWVWFITPIFGIRAITVYEAVGLSIFASAIMPVQSGQKSDHKSEFSTQHPIVDAVLHIFIAPAILLAVAWVWHTYFSNTF